MLSVYINRPSEFFDLNMLSSNWLAKNNLCYLFSFLSHRLCNCHFFFFVIDVKNFLGLSPIM